jgi:hypothetical protein
MAEQSIDLSWEKQWVVCKKKMLGLYPCLRHKVTNELVIFGEKGQISKWNDELMWVIWYHKNGDETSTKFEPKDIAKYLKKAKVPKTAKEQKAFIL